MKQKSSKGETLKFAGKWDLSPAPERISTFYLWKIFKTKFW